MIQVVFVKMFLFSLCDLVISYFFVVSQKTYVVNRFFELPMVAQFFTLYLFIVIVDFFHDSVSSHQYYYDIFIMKDFVYGQGVSTDIYFINSISSSINILTIHSLMSILSDVKALSRPFMDWGVDVKPFSFGKTIS